MNTTLLQQSDICFFRIQQGECVCCKLPAMVFEINHHKAICHSCITDLFAKAPVIPMKEHLRLLERKQAELDSEITRIESQKEMIAQFSMRIKRKQNEIMTSRNGK